MKVFKKEKRHLSKHKKAKPNVRRSVTRKTILEDQEVNASGAMKRRKLRTERRADRADRLGFDLIRAMEWGSMIKRLQGKKLEEQKEIARVWMERRDRMMGIKR